MKKFLFTLAALLMVGSLSAEEYMYIDDFEVSQELLAQTAARNRRMTVNVKAHFEAYVSAWQVDLVTDGVENALPYGVTVAGASEGADMTMEYMDELCDIKTIGIGLNKGQNNTRFIAASTVAGYYWTEDMDPDNDDPVTYGANKWLGDYEQMFTITFQFAQDFQGATMVVRTAPASGADPRGPVCERGQVNDKEFHITVEGSQPQTQDFAGQIVFGDVTEDGLLPVSYTGEEEYTMTITLNGEPVELVDGNVQLVEGNNIVTVTISAEGYNDLTATYEGEWAPVVPEVTATPEIVVTDNAEEEYLMIEAVGAGTVKLYIDGMEVPNPFRYNYQDEEHEIVITATAQEEGKLISETATLTYTVPAKTPEPQPQVTDKPVINWYDNGEGILVTVTGNGTIILYHDDVEIARGENEVTYLIPYCEDPEGEEWGVSATAQEEGKEVSEYALATIEVPGAPAPQPYETPAPVVNVVTDTEAEVVTITATGEGTVIIYVNYFDGNGPVAVATGDGEATFEIPFGEEVAYVGVWATAQADEDALVGMSDTEYVEVPAKEVGPGPEDPHMVGYWLVMVQADGTEEFVQLNLGANGDYITAYDVIYPLYYNVGNFYFMIDGVAYGAPENETEANLGDSMMNPLSADNTNTYFVYNGYSYSIGVHLVIDQNTLEVVGYTAYVAKGGPVSVDELVNGKTVAGVRYYNMAGQEMQEANGMTIVVTTYTDGTTSAVKVMK